MAELATTLRSRDRVAAHGLTLQLDFAAGAKPLRLP